MRFGRKAKLAVEQTEHARRLIEKGEGRQYVADLLNVGRSEIPSSLKYSYSSASGLFRPRQVWFHHRDLNRGVPQNGQTELKLTFVLARSPQNRGLSPRINAVSK